MDQMRLESFLATEKHLADIGVLKKEAKIKFSVVAKRKAIDVRSILTSKLGDKTYSESASELEKNLIIQAS